MTKFDSRLHLFESKIYLDPIAILLIMATTNLTSRMKLQIIPVAPKIFEIASVRPFSEFHILPPISIHYYIK